MRIPTLSILAIAASLMASCSKHGNKIECFPTDPNNQKINGTWERRQAIGGFCGTCLFDYPAGNGNLIKFSDNTYERYVNGQLKASGTYQVFRDSSTFFRKMGNRIVYDNVTTGAKEFIELSDNKLSFVDEVYDYQVQVYFRTGSTN